MKNKFTLLFVLILLAMSYRSVNAQIVGEGGWRTGEKQIKISFANTEQIKELNALKLNMDYNPITNNVTAYVTPDELTQIESLNIPYIVEVEDLNSYYEDFWLTLDSYHTYQQIIELADSLAGAFPSICKKYVYGFSIQNRQCAALKISDNVEIDEPEPEVLFDGGIHGDEIGGPENIIRFARDLCLQYGSDPTVTNLINTREIWLYLMVNPDGRANMSRYNANGVDLNRDWCYMWDAWGGSSGPCSQIESKHLRSCMYNNQFIVHTTYHSGTEFISYPWSYRPDSPLDVSHINQLAGLYSSLSGYSYLPYGSGYNGMYAINGSTKDANYGVMGSVSWSIEISNSKQPPTSQIMQYYNWNYPSMIALIEYSGYGVEGIVTDASTGLPIAATVFVNNYFPTYSDPTAGDYHKYVIPGTYTIKVVANGYQSQTINNVVVTVNNSTVTNFQLQPGGGQYVYKFSSSQIPDNNYADEGLTPAAIGEPDNINYSIGKNGWCVLDMQYLIQDGIGADFTVYEGDTSPEGYYCYVGQTIDGPWVLLGTGNGTTQFDLSIAAVSQAQFIKILDDGDGVAVSANAGFDLDAIKATDIIPVELVSFTAENIDEEVVLKWRTATETNNSGFEVERRASLNPSEGGTFGEWKSLIFIPGKGTTTEKTDYIFYNKISEPGIYVYRLKQMDFDGTVSYSDEVEIDVTEPKEFALHQNYPNPFNPSTKIEYQIPNVIANEVKQSQLVTLKVYDILGNEVATLVNEEQTAGAYEVEFSTSSGIRELVSGIYFYQLKAGSFIETKKMILVK